MTVTREDLHRLVDAVDDDKVPSAAALLRGLTGQEEQADRGFSFIGAISGGPADLAERHEDYLREYFSRSS